ncbi:MAG TPA: tetratricopeptide repeat protein [Anaerolineales bacterium]|nr:tetratricopeptide repeat protein [Anaerolineales bacterium]
MPRVSPSPLASSVRGAAFILGFLLVGCTPQAPDATGTQPPSTTTPKPIATASPSVDPSLVDAARRALTQGDLPMAVDLAQAVLEVDPNNSQAALVLSAAQNATGNYSAAIEALLAVEVVKVEDADDLNAMLDAYVALSRATFNEDLIRGAIEGADSVADRLLTVAPDSADFSLGAVLLGSAPNYAVDVSGATEEAIIHFQAAEELYGAGRFDDAATEYEEALSAYPGFSLAAIYLADSYFAKADYASAESLLAKTLQDDPTLIQAWDFLGHTYERMGLWRHSRISYLSALMLDPNDDFAWDGLRRLAESYSAWTTSYFDEFNLTITLPPALVASEILIGELGPASRDHGGFSLSPPDHSLIVTFSWQPLAADKSPSDLVPGMLSDVVGHLPGAEQRTEVDRFPYATFPLWYVEFLYTPPSQPNPNVSFAASWACQGTLFNLQLALPTEDFQPLEILRNKLLDPVTCPAA